MKLIASAGSPVRLTLARDRLQSLKRGHPWVFRDFLVEVPKAPPGSLAILRERTGKVIAQGIYDPDSHLAFRSVALNPEYLDDDFVAARITKAYELRATLFGENTTAYRVLNGEGDGVPGLVCDRYGDHLVLQLDGAGPGNFWNLAGVAELLSELGAPRNVYRKNRAGEKKELSTTIRGEEPETSTIISENGVRFGVNIKSGQKTGFFLDQRENRQRIRSLSAGRRVLNLFGYTGGFSLYAGHGGARHVTTVDSAKPAIADANSNWILNGLPESAHFGVAEDAFDFLARATEKKEVWDLVIVDPPSFAPGKQHVEKAEEAYISIFSSAIEVTAPGGILAASSCSSHISPEHFLTICENAFSNARRRATVLGIYGQPEDHPFPLACRELQYLKFVLFTVH